MIAQNFPEANAKFGPPDDFEESQVRSVPAHVGEIKQGSCEGQKIVVVCWKPTENELNQLNMGGCVFLTMFNVLVPHCLTTSFEAAVAPA